MVALAGVCKHHHAFKDSFYDREYFYASVSPKCFTDCGKVTNNFRSIFRTRVTLMSAVAFLEIHTLEAHLVL